MDRAGGLSRSSRPCSYVDKLLAGSEFRAAMVALRNAGSMACAHDVDRRGNRGGGRMTSPQAMLNFIATGDQRLMRRVNRWQPPRWIRLWMICATRGGDGWLWYAMGLIILLFGG